MGRSKFFKDAKNVRHFKLVARSQNDRFAADPNAPQLVLEPYAPPGVVKRSDLTQAELLTVPEDLEAALGPEVFAQPTDEPERDPLDETGAPDPNDLEGDCYFPRDGYNYEKHLKRASGGEGGGVVGVVIDAPPDTQVPRKQLVMQPATNQEEAEVLKALENAEEYEEMEDFTLDEMVGGGIAEATDTMLWGPTAEQDRDLPDLALFKSMRLRGESTVDEEDEDDDCRSRGSRAGRSVAVSDADFEQFLDEEYGDDDIGACDNEEIEGKVSLEKCEVVLDEYVFMKKEERARLASIYEPIKGTRDDVPRTIDETRAIIEKHYKFEDDSETSSGEESEDESKTWDCETVLSTLSNISNRPGKIGRIKVIEKKKPMPALKPVREGAEAEAAEEAGEEDEAVVELPDVSTTRPKDETPEERKARKAGVKEMRRLCRRMKKDSKDTYKAEAQKLQGHTGADVRGKTRCFRM